VNILRPRSGVVEATKARTESSGKLTGPERGNGKGITTESGTCPCQGPPKFMLFGSFSAAFRCYHFRVTPFGASEVRSSARGRAKPRPESGANCWREGERGARKRGCFWSQPRRARTLRPVVAFVSVFVSMSVSVSVKPLRASRNLSATLSLSSKGSLCSASDRRSAAAGTRKRLNSTFRQRFPSLTLESGTYGPRRATGIFYIFCLFWH
jgi:hypothetical protein